VNEEGKDHRTVSRVMGILEHVARHPNGVRMPDLVRELDAPRTSLYGLVSGLVSCGYLQPRAEGFVLGPAIGALTTPRRTIDEVARPVLTALSAEVGETVMLAVRTGDFLVYVDAVETTQLIRYSAPLYEHRELYPASAGKCFLAFGPQGFAEQYLKRFIKPAQREAVRTEMASIVRNGYSVNRGETIPDVTAVAVPVLTRDRLMACIAVAGPSVRISVPQISVIATHARKAAAAVSELLQ
jgi:DNA-binding IclR family transcriptional regulator